MRFTTRDGLRAWLDSLAHNTDLIAPRDVDGHVLYRPVGAADEVLLEYERPELSAKTYVLPDTEVLMRIEKHAKGAKLEDLLPDRPQVLFGLRPCDAHGIVAIDALFLEKDPSDAYYRAYRERTTLIGMACSQMWDGCFCTSVGGGPTDQTHLDVMFQEVEGGYMANAVTPKGVAILEGLALEEPPKEPPPAVGRYAKPVPLMSPDKWRSLFEDNIWMRHGERCLSCRICTYVCPTCRCFDVVDRAVGVRNGVAHIERIRVWDACTSTNYRRAAGGHNSRPTKPVRLRNRFFCKFCYYPEDFGPLGCVGCGRCVVSCPVDIDIREVMQEVAETS
jgi:sulfhydrogenase subunit beta (sulfur reductase)